MKLELRILDRWPAELIYPSKVLCDVLWPLESIAMLSPYVRRL